MKHLLLLAGIITSLLFACQDNSKPAHQHDGEGTAEQSTPVTLNNGEKWAANTETTEGIQKMTALINALPAHMSQDDYHSLKINMETEFNLILQKCTMTGEAHEQLHNYLIPMQAMFEGLGSQDNEACRAALNKLKQHLGEYENYFQTGLSSN
jgi:hypothetical protein